MVTRVASVLLSIRLFVAQSETCSNSNCHSETLHLLFYLLFLMALQRRCSYCLALAAEIKGQGLSSCPRSYTAGNGARARIPTREWLQSPCAEALCCRLLEQVPLLLSTDLSLSRALCRGQRRDTLALMIKIRVLEPESPKFRPLGLPF